MTGNYVVLNYSSHCNSGYDDISLSDNKYLDPKFCELIFIFINFDPSSNCE
jgi:hypothetical protein